MAVRKIGVCVDMDFMLILDQARAELRDMEEQRVKLERFIAATEEIVGRKMPEARKTIPAPQDVRPDAKPRVASVLGPTRAAVGEILNERGRPIETRDLLPLVRAKGVDVGGKDPIATLSARLSNSPEFYTTRGVGWWFKDHLTSNATHDLLEAEDQDLKVQSSASEDNSGEEVIHMPPT